MFEISPTAAKEIKRIQLHTHKLKSSLRLKVKSGGCSGLFYDLQLEDSVDSQDGNHQAVHSNDRLLEINDIHVVVSSESWEYIENLKLDYSEDLMGGGFRFHNPKVTNVCGCGISFAATK
ncbi:iron-sulfur cluster assembly accessory protein [Pleurocapsa sp. PCC 7319]|uniref:HesB/IscA family protein n=1 Tax=Pleurocapsa sp. PCC 7319 TaxID=118161 RepID=UPI00034CAEEE|nr:iron-sulfur cluster assembly accessory protein [Pleurocapsa sp. PCC 7319]